MLLRYKKIQDKVGNNRLFFIGTLLIFLLLSIFKPESSLIILKKFRLISKSLIQILGIIYLLIFIFSLLLSNKKIITFLKQGNYTRKLFIATLAGIVSSGPVYLRYGFLRTLHESGLSFGHIAAFSYARAIKIPLFPIMIGYFGIKFTLIFTGVLFMFSFLQSIGIDYIIPDV